MSGPADDARAVRNCLGGHAMAIGKEMDVARLQRLDLLPAGLLIGGPDVLARKRHLRICRRRETVGGRVACGRGTVGQEFQQRLGDRVGDVDRDDRLQSRPGRHAVDLEHEKAPSAAGTMSTPAKSAPTASAAAIASSASSASPCPRNLLGHCRLG